MPDDSVTAYLDLVRDLQNVRKALEYYPDNEELLTIHDKKMKSYKELGGDPAALDTKKGRK